MKESSVLGLSCLCFCLSMDIKCIHGACGVYLLGGWGNFFLFVRSLLHFLRRLIYRNLAIQLDTVFTLEPIVPGFYERNFPLTWKAFRDASWKSAIREPGMEVGQVAEFQANICKLWLQSKGTVTLEHQQFYSSLKAILDPVHEKVVVYVPGYYENKKPWTRKAFHTVRMASEVTGKALDSGPEKVQASGESEEDRAIIVTVGHITAVSELREALHTVPVIHSDQNSLWV